jgi:hypothetical protein
MAQEAQKARQLAAAPTLRLVTKRIPVWGTDGVFRFIRSYIDVEVSEDTL